jgi:DNA primase
MDEAEGRAACLHEAKPLLAAMPECALRVQIEREIARAVQLTPEEMAHLIAQAPAQPYGQPTSAPKLEAGTKFAAADRGRRPGPGQAGVGPADAVSGAGGGIHGESGALADAGNASHPMDDVPLEAYSAGEYSDQDVEYLISGYDLDHSGVPGSDIDPLQGYGGGSYGGEGQYGIGQGGQHGGGQGGQYGGGQGGQYGGARQGGAGYGGRPGQGKGQGGGFRKNDRGGNQGSWGKGKGNWRDRDRDQGVIEPPRPVPTLPKRLLFLLLLHPELVDGMGDQQLEVLDSGPHLGLVRELIVLAQTSGARHVGALLEAAEPDSDLSGLLRMMRASVLAGEDLPDPQAEWDDALHRIEFDAIRVEMQNLASSGLADEEGRKRYQDLSRRLQVLKGAGIR